ARWSPRSSQALRGVCAGSVPAPGDRPSISTAHEPRPSSALEVKWEPRSRGNRVRLPSVAVDAVHTQPDHMRMTRRTLSVTAGALLLLATAAPAGAQAPTDTPDATGAAPDRGGYEVTARAAHRQPPPRAGGDRRRAPRRPAP